MAESITSAQDRLQRAHRLQLLTEAVGYAQSDHGSGGPA